MANYCVVQTGYSDVAATFGTVANTPTIHDLTNITITTGSTYTLPFTAPSLTDSVLGVAFPFYQAGSAGTITAQLQEGGVDVVGAAVTINLADIGQDRWVYMKLPTPYMYATTAANQYRWRIFTTTPTGTTQIAATAAGANPAYRSIDDRSAVPGAGDTIFNAGENASSTLTLTMRGTQIIGNHTENYATINGNNRPWRRAIHDLYMGDHASMVLDKTASGDLTIQGCFVVGRGSEIDWGDNANPITKANNWVIQIDLNSVTSNYAIILDASGSDYTFKAFGEDIGTHTTYVSGTGTAADPMIIDEDIGISVGDKIAMGGDAYGESEDRTVVAVSGGTSLELSSALTYSHVAGTPVIQLTQGLEIKSTDPAYYWFFRNGNTTDGNVEFKNVRLADVGGTLTYARGFIVAPGQGYTMDVDFCSFENVLAYGLYSTLSRETESFTYNVFYDLDSNQNSGAIAMTSGVAKTVEDCVVIKSARSGSIVSGLFASTFRRCKFWNCGLDNNGNTGGAQLTSSGSLNFIDCEVEASRTHAFVVQNASEILWQNCSLGSIADNPNAFTTTPDNYNPGLRASNCNFGTGTMFDDYDIQTTGSKLVIENKNDVQYANFTYSKEGISQFCGTGLDDTTLTPLLNRSVRLAPEDDVIGVVVETKIPVFVDGTAQLYGKLKINNAFGSDDFDVELYMPESDDPSTPDVVETYNYTDGNWVNFSIAQAYEGSNPGFARVVFRAKSTNPGAYAYIGDFYDATDETNPLASFGAAFQGEIAPVMAATIYDYAGVWGVLTNTLTTDGTTGKKLVDNLKRSHFLALKDI